MAKSANINILLIGAGKMGGALLEAWLKSGHGPSITVLDTQAKTRAKYAASCKVISDLKETSDDFTCIVLAIKPQRMDTMCLMLTEKFSIPVPTLVGARLGEGRMGHDSAEGGPHPNPPPTEEWEANAPFYLSIAAGKTLGYFEKLLPGTPVVRAMPNTPATIGLGVTALCANLQASEQQKAFADSLMRPAGELIWLEDESLMNAVTALSGSGPAYMFLFLEALAAAGVAQGMPQAMARTLALHTMHGSAALALQSDESLAQLRRNVTSPGGTTEAALEVLTNEAGLIDLVEKAVAAAVERARELA